MKDYILSLLSAALLCCVAQGFFIEKSTVGSVVKMLCGIVMILTVVSPWASIRLRDLGDCLDSIHSDSSLAVGLGENMAQNELREIIKSRVEAYILDKANNYGAQLTVEVILSEEQIPVPISLHISGNISPYGKKMLSKMISEDLGIGLEDQVWTP